MLNIVLYDIQSVYTFVNAIKIDRVKILFKKMNCNYFGHQ